jgi:hypothetical protein
MEKSQWRKKIEKLEVGESVKVTYQGGDMTFRVQVYGNVARAMNAKYSVHKLKEHHYLITRKV